jgi:hypothetical protein
LQNGTETAELNGLIVDLTQTIAVGQDLSTILIPGEPLPGVFQRHEGGAVGESRPVFVERHLHTLTPLLRATPFYGEMDVRRKTRPLAGRNGRNPPPLPRE